MIEPETPNTANGHGSWRLQEPQQLFLYLNRVMSTTASAARNRYEKSTIFHDIPELSSIILIATYMYSIYKTHRD
jgi:hypothetical protein